MPGAGNEPGIGRFALILALPAAAGLLAAVVFGALGFWSALLYWLVALGAAAVLARGHAADLQRIARAFGGLFSEARPNSARFEGVLGTQDIGASLDRAADAFGALTERAEDRLRVAEAIVEALPHPFLLLGPDRAVLQCNRAARDLLGTDLPGRNVAEALRDPAVLDAVRRAIDDAQAAGGEFAIADKVTRNFLCRALPIAAHGPGEPAAILLLEEATEAKRTERMRADFVANASHEIRTPLAAVAGFLETLVGPARDDAPARERFLGLMGEQVARIRRLVDDLLSLSRIEVREHMAPTAPLAIEPVIRAAIGTLAFRAKTLGVDIALEVAPGLPAIAGDGAELEQVFQNLIDNAINYGAGKPVRVIARLAQPDEAQGAKPALAVIVEDQGPGIAREHLPRLTERFFRIDAARSRQMGGTGLGLAIVKHIVNRHRAQLAIRSEAGKGSQFCVYFPIIE